MIIVLVFVSMVSCFTIGLILGMAIGYGGGYEEAINDTKKLNKRKLGNK